MNAAPTPRTPLLLTPGEPAGIGPDLAVMLAQTPLARQVVAVADPELLAARARQLQLPLQVLDETAPWPRRRCGALRVRPVALAVPARAGVLDPRNAAYVLQTLNEAADACLRGTAAAIVTGPVQKSTIADTGIPFSGQTEYLAARSGGATPVMMLVAGGLRVALATTHLPLRAVADAITRDGLHEVLSILHRDLRSRFGLAAPRILVCGLNPHAGESGHLGREEIDVITPVVTALRAAGLRIEGPLPADTLFTPARLRNVDAVLAMFHDQGLPVLKYAGFGTAVNVTLGLPLIRTSVDHGTALDHAGRGSAEAGSLHAALRLARQLASAAAPPSGPMSEPGPEPGSKPGSESGSKPISGRA